MAIQVGDRIPEVQLTLATPEGPIPVKSSDYFAGKRVALFAVPGAYTPTCSARHLPSYVERAAELKSKGVDEVACTSVNDAFVMGAGIATRARPTSPCWPTGMASSQRPSA